MSCAAASRTPDPTEAGRHGWIDDRGVRVGAGETAPREQVARRVEVPRVIGLLHEGKLRERVNGPRRDRDERERDPGQAARSQERYRNDHVMRGSPRGMT